MPTSGALRSPSAMPSSRSLARTDDDRALTSSRVDASCFPLPLTANETTARSGAAVASPVAVTLIHRLSVMTRSLAIHEQRVSDGGGVFIRQLERESRRDERVGILIVSQVDDDPAPGALRAGRGA